MPNLYAQWMESWEHRLASQDKNRRVLEFDWGLSWLDETGLNGEPADRLLQSAETALADSDRFFSYLAPRDYALRSGIVTFTSALPSPFAENNIVYAEYSPARRSHGRAVLVIPQWNAHPGAQESLCKMLNRFGLSTLRLSKPYHGRRKPAGQERAEYHVSSNLGRTIHATRQAVIDSRCCLDWLESQGYHRFGILGTSLGSCISFITTAHDRRIRAGVYNHVSSYFGDVVWCGLSTRHVRLGLESRVTQDELRRYWAAISPFSYVARFGRKNLKSLLIWTGFDPTFLPVFSKQLLGEFDRLGVPYNQLRLPCGHYTLGEFPFNLIDGLAMSAFLRAHL